MPDMNGADVGLQGDEVGSGTRYPKIDFQLKCTGSPDWIMNGQILSYTLDIRTYNIMRDYTQTPMILAVMVLPAVLAEWTIQSHDMLGLKYCTYWTSLFNALEQPNLQAINVHLPRQNMLTVNVLKDIFQKAVNGVRYEYSDPR